MQGDVSFTLVQDQVVAAFELVCNIIVAGRVSTRPWDVFGCFDSDLTVLRLLWCPKGRNAAVLER